MVTEGVCGYERDLCGDGRVACGDGKGSVVTGGVCVEGMGSAVMRGWSAVTGGGMRWWEGVCVDRGGLR